MILWFTIMCWLALFGLLFAIPTHAMTVKTPAQIEDYIIYKAMAEQLDVNTVLNIARCESRFYADRVGDGGKSYGVFQIHLPAHPEVSAEQALNPAWNVNWAIEQMVLGKFKMWSCYKS